jgi:hypothetical protein
MKERVEPGDQDSVQTSPQKNKASRQKPVYSMYEKHTPIAQGKLDAPAASLTQSSPPVKPSFDSGFSIPSKDLMETATVLNAPKTAATNGTSVFQNPHTSDYSRVSSDNLFGFLSTSAASKPSNSRGFFFDNAVSPTHLESEKSKLSNSPQGGVTPASRTITPSKGLLFNFTSAASSSPSAGVTGLFGSSSTPSTGISFGPSSSGTTQHAFGSSQKGDSSNSESSTHALDKSGLSKPIFGELPKRTKFSESAELVPGFQAVLRNQH